MYRFAPAVAVCCLLASACSAKTGDDIRPVVGTDGGNLLDVSQQSDVDIPDGVIDMGSGETNMCPGAVQSFIWIANTGEGTVSKVCTIDGKEVARYYTSSQTSGGDPSRTSVNLHGDMVVTNRSPTSGPSSVTKIIAEILECPDTNKNGMIDTSFGSTEVLPWGTDECVAWNTPLTSGVEIGARATAWDGTESSKTGLGGSVFIGAMMNKTIYKLNGDTGEIVSQQMTQIQHYGGAIDNKRNFWTVAMMCTIGQCSIQRANLDNLTDTEVIPVQSGYGISIDGKGRVWTSGMGGVNRYDPSTKTHTYLKTGTGTGDFNRGVAVGAEKSAGFVWVANTGGDLLQIDPEAVTVVKRQHVGGSEMVGVAIDYQGYVWTVSKDLNSAHKVDPGTWDVLTVPIGSGPYTYSDMTGMQLRGALGGPK